MSSEVRQQTEGLGAQVKGAILWRSGSQIVAQIIQWLATFLVIRLLDPSDYGLVAMTQVVLVFLNLMNGYGFANALIRAESIGRREIRQVFGMLLLLNAALAAAQLALAPLAAAYFHQPIVAELLRVQALMFLATPFIALPTALLSRDMDFRRQAQVNLIAAMLSALTAFACASAGWGVWTLVATPLVLFWTRAVGMTIAARSLVWPSFRFAGAGKMASYGGAMVLVQLFWFVQSQSDIFIGGRLLGPHDLGLYTTALFLTQILASKFVPPLNDIAFAAYSRMQGERDALAFAFLKSVRLIMLVALPFYCGLVATAEPLVLTFMGAKWAETAPLVTVLALAMPLLTLQILFAPATNAINRAGIALRCAMAGAVILPIAFLTGIGFGTTGLAYGWLIGMALLTLVTAALSMPALGLQWRALIQSIAPGLLASSVMGLAVMLLDSALPAMAPPARLALLVSAGAALYAALLLLFARPLVEEVRQLIRRVPPESTATA